MKKSLLFTLFILLMVACSSPQPIQPRYVVPKSYKEKVNLSEIKLESMEGTTEPLSIYKGLDGNNYLLMNLLYDQSGISVIEAIKSGEILENKIIVRDNTGKIIGSDAINFQAFTKIENKLYKNAKSSIQTLDGFVTPVRTDATRTLTGEVPEITYTPENIIYKDSDKVPQAIRLTELPPANSYVSILVELTYVQPFLQQVCNFNNKELPCSYIEDGVQKEIRTDNERKFKAIKEEEKKSTAAPSKKFGLTDKEFASYKDKMKRKVNSTGTSIEASKEIIDPTDASKDKKERVTSVVDVEKAKLRYREWVLLSEPKFFPINTQNIKTIVDPSKDAKTTTTETKTSTTVITEKIPMVEGFGETVTFKNGQTFKNVKTTEKDGKVIITTQDGKTIEVNKTDLMKK
jgi:uncharacterized protein YcfL